MFLSLFPLYFEISSQYCHKESLQWVSCRDVHSQGESLAHEKSTSLTPSPLPAMSNWLPTPATFALKLILAFALSALTFTILGSCVFLSSYLLSHLCICFCPASVFILIAPSSSVLLKPSSDDVSLCLAAQLCVWLFVTPWTVARQAFLSMGILQARILEWVAMPSSRGSSQPWDRTQVSHIAGGFLTVWATRKAQESWSGEPIPSPGDLPNPGIELWSLALQVDSLPAELQMMSGQSLKNCQQEKIRSRPSITWLLTFIFTLASLLSLLINDSLAKMKHSALAPEFFHRPRFSTLNVSLLSVYLECLLTLSSYANLLFWQIYSMPSWNKICLPW